MTGESLCNVYALKSLPSFWKLEGINGATFPTSIAHFVMSTFRLNFDYDG